MLMDVGDEMRLKHVKGAREKIESSFVVIEEPRKWKGKYKELFQNNHPIYIEIGTGKGNFIIESAKRHPEINFIGIEKYDSAIVKAVLKAEAENLKNLKLICMDAIEIEEIFEHEISMIYLNFSDPWPKKRHAHRRLSSPRFLNRYQSLFVHDIKIEMKTDNRHLFEYSIMSFLENGFSIEQICLNLYEEDITDNIPTEYEKKFVEKGFPIYKICVTKPF